MGRLDGKRALVSGTGGGIGRATGLLLAREEAHGVGGDPIDQLSYADWSFTMRNELDIVFLVTRAAWPHLIAAGGGSVVNVASITASRGAFFMPQNAHGAAGRPRASRRGCRWAGGGSRRTWPTPSFSCARTRRPT